MHVIKRNGDKEVLNIDKIHKVVQWACENITGVSVSEIEIKSHIQFYNNIKTKDIHEMMIKSAADLISEETPNYQYVAGRLINYALRKEVYTNFKPDSLYDIIKKNINLGFYTPELLEWYTKDEIDHFDNYINHNKDFEFTYAAAEQLRGKYLIKNRVTNQIFETPQVMYILIAMTLFNSYKENRNFWVKELYDIASDGYISLPTPIMAAVRTKEKQFSSCVLIKADDSLNSISATADAIIKYVSKKAGIGVDVGKIRAINSPIRNGNAYHTGIIPFIKHFQTAVKSCSQGSVRNGAATVYYPIWHLEVEDLLVLKNNKGTEENRARHLDYAVQFSKLFYERLIQNKDITLFSPNDVPEMYEAFFVDNDKFKMLYEKAEHNTKLRKKKIPAIELFSTFMQERKDTGRIYLLNVDHANSHGSFIPEVAPIYQSNLCSEISLPTKPLDNIFDESGEISLCTLASINWGKIKSPDDFERPCRVTVRALDALLSYQNYPIKAAELSTMGRRPLGVGIINFAYWLAKNNLTYTGAEAKSETLKIIHEYTEAWSYYLIKESVELAKFYGPCIKNKETRYSLGVLPIDTYKKEIDELITTELKYDWDGLREDLKIYGIRNSTLMAVAPTETSSQISNATNGIEPPRSFVSIKQSKDGMLKQVVPEYKKLKNKYELLWDQKSPYGYLNITLVLQKFIDQTISTNVSMNPKFYPNEEIPMSELLKQLVYCYKYGQKTQYYFNTYDGAGEIDDKKDDKTDDKKEEPVLNDEIIPDAECDSCVI